MDIKRESHNCDITPINMGFIFDRTLFRNDTFIGIS